MQLKKIFWSLLVVIMILSTAVFSISAAEDTLEFSVAFIATADSEGNVVVNPGDPVDVNITITNNPGVAAFSFKLKYDANLLEPVMGTLANGTEVVVFESAEGSDYSFVSPTGYTIKLIDDGIINVNISSPLSYNSTYTGDLVTISFKFKSDVTGDAVVEISDCRAKEFVNGSLEDVNVAGSKATLAGHNYDDVEYVPATCYEDEYTIYKCTDEGCTASYIIKGDDKATNHEGTTEILAAKAPTCTETGLTEGKWCTKCGDTLVEQEVIDATGHVEYVIDAIPATCASEGRTEGKACAVCNAFIVEPKITVRLSHEPEKDDGGNIKWYNDDRYPISCSMSGLKYQKCDFCGTNINYQVVPALEHNKDVKIDAVPATCTSEGLTDGAKCSGCDIITKVQQVVDKIAHDEKVIAGFDATCEGKGLTEGKICSVCNTITVEQTVIPAKGHNNDVVIDGFDATCEGKGLTAGNKCSVCNTITVEQTVIPAKGHTESVLEAVEPTCTSIGLTEGKICDVCGVATVPQTIVDAKGHTEEKIPAVEATCTAAGSTEGVKCSVCDVVLDPAEVVQPKGHTEVEIPAVEPTYSEDGSTEGKQCTTCNTITDATGVIPAKSLAWLWVLIGGVVVAGGLVAVYFFVLRKKN